jgi:hypothetical protein
MCNTSLYCYYENTASFVSDEGPFLLPPFKKKHKRHTVFFDLEAHFYINKQCWGDLLSASLVIGVRVCRRLLQKDGSPGNVMNSGPGNVSLWVL